MEAFVRELAPTAARVREEGADATLDVHPRIGLRGAGEIRQRVEVVLALHQHLGDRLEHRRALMKRERAHRRAAYRAGVVHHRLEIEPGAGRLADLLAGDGIEQIGFAAGAFDPLAHRIVLEQVHHGVPPSRVSFQFFNTLDCVGRSSGTARSGSTTRQLARMAAGNC